ncbi:hypothetical protein TSAR_013382, partial [Trichomalopsis sarcophagae]
APETDTSAQTSSVSGKALSPLVVHRAFYNKCIRKTIFVAYEVDRESSFSSRPLRCACIDAYIYV